jgi:hypothetical protein
MTKYDDRYVHKIATSGPFHKNPKLRKKYNETWNKEGTDEVIGKKQTLKTKIVRKETHHAEQYLKALKRYSQSRSHRGGK